MWDQDWMMFGLGGVVIWYREMKVIHEIYVRSQQLGGKRLVIKSLLCMSATFHSKAELAKTCCRVGEKQRQAQARHFLAFLVSSVTANSTKRSLWVALVKGCVGRIVIHLHCSPALRTV